MVIAFIEGWAKITKSESHKRKYIEKCAEIIYSSAKQVPDGKISISDIGQWLEVNENFTSLLSQFEPSMEVSEKSSLFLPIPRPASHLQELTEKYLGKY